MRTTSIKNIMYGFNVVFVITGIILVAIGASVKSHYYPYYTFLDDRYFSLPNMLIATGSLIFFISLLGCYGTMRESWSVLMAFSVLLTIIFVFELSVSIAGYVLNDKTSAYIESTLLTKMTEYENSNDISAMWDLIQEEFQCCGVKNYGDWEPIFKNYSLPLSCCKLPNGMVGAFYCNSAVQNFAALSENTDADATTAAPAPETTTPAPEPTTVPPGNSTYPPSTRKPYESGCHTLLSDFLKRHATNIGAVGISLAIIQLAGIFLSFHLARQLKNSYYST